MLPETMQINEFCKLGLGAVNSSANSEMDAEEVEHLSNEATEQDSNFNLSIKRIRSSESIDVILDHRKRFLCADWNSVPQALLLSIFQYLSADELLRAGLSCTNWYEASTDESLWKELVCQDFHVKRSCKLTPGKQSWRFEYKRLSYHTPMVQTDEIKHHTNEVLHVSFSHNGKMFATSSKDTSIIVWNAVPPVTAKYHHDMKSFIWCLTQFSQFNPSDTLLLVSGAYCGAPQMTSGEIAVFSLTDRLDLLLRVKNIPYDVFGAWFSDQHIISGELLPSQGPLTKCILWLNKASPETEAKENPSNSTNKLFRFYNYGSSVRSVMVARCQSNRQGANDLLQVGSENCSNGSRPSNSSGENNDASEASGSKSINPVIIRKFERTSVPTRFRCLDSRKANFTLLLENDSSTDDDSSTEESSRWDEVEFDNPKGSKEKIANNIDQQNQSIQIDNEIDFEEDKLLIFTMGSESYSPNQIGIKRIKSSDFPSTNRIIPGLVLPGRSTDRQDGSSSLNSDNVEYDKVDHVINFHGHIIGMALSPDHRYLYVNTRSWPEGYVFDGTYDPPPIAQEIDIHVLDLVTMKEVREVMTAHRAFTSSIECFYMFLDVSEEYVASGAEDKHGYLWDRYYGSCLVKFPHLDVVNSVAFNPKDTEMLVTVSDDSTIKVWHSRNRVKELGLDASTLPKAKNVCRKPSCCNCEEGKKRAESRRNRTVYMM